MDSMVDTGVEAKNIEERNAAEAEMMMDAGPRRSSDGGPPPFNRNRSFKTKQLVRSQAIRESQSPPRVPSPRSPGAPERRPLSASGKVKSASFDADDRPENNNSFKLMTNLACKNNPLVFTSGDKETLGANNETKFIVECKNVTKENNDNAHNLAEPKIDIIKCEERKEDVVVEMVQDDKVDSDDTCRLSKAVEEISFKDSIITETNQIEIQVTDATYVGRRRHDHTGKTVAFHPFENKVLCNKDCDCGIGPSLEIDEDEELPEEESKYYNTKITNNNNNNNSSNNNNNGRRAMCASKQDSGVCCWESCNSCGDISPEIILSDAEDEHNKVKCPFEHEHLGGGNDFSRQNEKWTRQNGSTLSVQRSNSGGGNPRLLRKQSSGGGGSMDSGPFLSRDGSTETSAACWDGDISKFIKETLNKSSKDRQTLLKLEDDMIKFIKDSSQKEIKFPASSSYVRLLIHRCADLFGLRHMLEPVGRVVIVAKIATPGITYKIPSMCPFKQWCTGKFPSSPTGFAESLQAKSILKRDKESFDEEPSSTTSTTGPPKLLQTPKSKSFEQREEEYVKARRRIFNTGQFQSMENQPVTPNVRGVVSKAHSFGGYGGRPGVQRGDSVTSSTSAPPHRILSRQGEMASNCWKLSPCSSGYKTWSGRSDSITPSPTSTPNVTGTEPFSKSPDGDGNKQKIPGVLWAISDMSSVPSGAVIIHPQTGEPLTNNDGSLYHYDPSKPLHSALLPHSPQRLAPENVKVLSNPERRRSRLEKQRATLSPGVEVESVINNESSRKQSESDVGELDNRANSQHIETRKPYTNNSNSEIVSPRPSETLNAVVEDPPNTSSCPYDIGTEIEESKQTNSQTDQSTDYQEYTSNNQIAHYSDPNGSTYYNVPAQIATSQQYFQPAPMYSEPEPEIYPSEPLHPQQISYIQRANENMMPSNATMPSQLTHPHIVFAPPPCNELCYPTIQAPMIIQPTQFRYNLETDAQAAYHLVSTAVDQQQQHQRQQPILVALPNKPPEQDISPHHHQLASYSAGSYHPQLQAQPPPPPPAPILGMPTHDPYQFQGSPGWGCWPQMTLYAAAPPPSTAPAESEDPPKYPGHTFLSQPPPGAEARPNVSPLTYYPPAASLMHPPRGQLYAAGPSPIVQGQIPVYANVQPYENQPAAFKNAESPYRDDQHVYNQIKSPKSASVSGSSRTTPLTNIQNADFNSESVYNPPSYQFVQQPIINYVPYPCPYPSATDRAPLNFENPPPNQRTKSYEDGPPNKDVGVRQQRGPMLTKSYSTNDEPKLINNRINRDKRKYIKPDESSERNNNIASTTKGHIQDRPNAEVYGRGTAMETKQTPPGEIEYGKNDRREIERQDSKANWRRLQNQKESTFHNFPKNLNRGSSVGSNSRPTSMIVTTDKDKMKYQAKDKNPKQRLHQAKTFDNPPSSPFQTVASSRLDTPPVSWNQTTSLCGNNPYFSFPNEMPGLFPAPPNVHRPPPPRPAESPAPPPTGIIGLPLPRGASFYQRASFVTGNGAPGMLPTPPAHGQSTFLFRQVPNWMRRAGPPPFGPPPPLNKKLVIPKPFDASSSAAVNYYEYNCFQMPAVAGQSRPRPPRHHQARF